MSYPGDMATELHRALQRYYACEEGCIEAEVGDFRADVLVDDTVYEIQTRGFTAIRDKLRKLARSHRVVLVFPVPRDKVIVRVDVVTGEQLSARRSPKHGQVADVFDELVYAFGLMRLTNFALEVLLTVERELRQNDGQGSWRRKGVSLVGRELQAIVGRQRFEKPVELLRLLPEGLPERFTVADLEDGLGIKHRAASRMAYVLRELGVIEHVGERGRAYMYTTAGGFKHRSART
jgi:hypothetical protein